MGLLVQSWNVIKGSSQSQICWFWTVWQVPRPLHWLSSLHSNTRKNAFQLTYQKNNIIFNFYRIVTCTIKLFVPCWITVTFSINTDAFVIAINITWTVKNCKNNKTSNHLSYLLDFSHIWRSSQKMQHYSLHGLVEFPGKGFGRLITINSELNGAT